MHPLQTCQQRATRETTRQGAQNNEGGGLLAGWGGARRRDSPQSNDWCARTHQNHTCTGVCFSFYTASPSARQQQRLSDMHMDMDMVLLCMALPPPTLRHNHGFFLLEPRVYRRASRVRGRTPACVGAIASLLHGTSLRDRRQKAIDPNRAHGSRHERRLLERCIARAPDRRQASSTTGSSRPARLFGVHRHFWVQHAGH